MIEVDVLAYLKADATLTTLAGGRIYPKTAKQKTLYPYIVYNASTTPEASELMNVERLEYRIHAKKDAEVASIRNRLNVILDKKAGIRGVISSATFNFFHSERVGTVPMVDKTDQESPDYIEVCIYEVKFASKI